MTRARRIPGGRKLLAAASLLFACTNTPAQQPRDAGADAASDAAEPDIAADVASPTDEGNPIDLADEGGDVRDMGGGAAAVIYADGDDFEVVDAFGPRVGGMFRGTLTFEPGTARERTLTSRGERDIFLAEVGVNGELVRVYHWGGPSDDGLWRRSTAQDQPLGWFTDEMTLDDGTTTSSVQHTGLSTFVIRVDRPEERTLSDWPIDGIGPSMLRVVDVSYGRTLYAGEFTGSITINAPDGAPVELQSRGGTDIFAAL